MQIVLTKLFTCLLHFPVKQKDTLTLCVYERGLRVKYKLIYEVQNIGLYKT